MVPMETKILEYVHCKKRLGYNIACSREFPTVDGGVQGGMVLVTGETPEGWDTESMRFHGPNMVSCEIVSVSQHPPSLAHTTPLSILDYLPDL